MTAAGEGRSLWGAAAVTAIAVAVLVGLGTWQFERLGWKQDLIATLERRLAADPVPLPPAAEWPRLTPADEFRRVTFTATFLHDKEALVYSAGSGLRRDVSGVGYFVFTPARLADGAVVLVDRGFVPEMRRDRAGRRDGDIAGPVALTGVLRWPETPGLFTPAADPAANQWFARDTASIALAKGLGSLPDFYIDQEAPEPPGGLPRPGRLVPSLPNNHFGYMLTWYGLAAAAVAVFAALALSRRRRPGPAERG